MKKYLSILTAAVLLSSLAACTDEDDSSSGSKASTTASSTEADTTDVTSEAKTTEEKTTEAQTTAEASTAEKTTEAGTDTSGDGYTEDQLKYMATEYYGTRNNVYPEFCDVTLNEDDTASIMLYSLFDGHVNMFANYTVDSNTGIGKDSTGNDVDLTAEPEMLWNPDIPERKEMKENNAFCGIAHVGSVGPYLLDLSTYNAAYIETILQSGVTEKFDFFSDLPDRNLAQTQQGMELYLVIPRDSDARVTVTQYDIDNDRDLGSIYSSYNGSPFLLKCNYSDIASDVKIKIVDNDGEHEEFTVGISMRDGEPAASSEGVMFFPLERNIPQ